MSTSGSSQALCEIRPPINSDVSGVGVRISFYLQTLLLGCLSVRSRSPDEITDALYTLVATNTAMSVTSLLLGLKPHPEISLQDALVIFYLLAMSWVTIVLTLPSYHERRNPQDILTVPMSSRLLQMFSILQSFTVFAFTLVLLIKAETFGGTPACNRTAVVVLFRPFPALNAGRIIGCIVVAIVFIVYVPVTAMEFRRQFWEQRKCEEGVVVPKQDVQSEKRPEQPRELHIPHIPSLNPASTLPTYHDVNFDGVLVVKIMFTLIVWALAVLNTELLIKQNRPTGSVDSWQFGQVLPLCLVVLPLTKTFASFWEHGLRPINKKGARARRKRRNSLQAVAP